MSVVDSGGAGSRCCPLKLAAQSVFPSCNGPMCMAWREVHPGMGYCGLAGFPYQTLPADRTATGLSMLLNKGEKP